MARFVRILFERLERQIYAAPNAIEIVRHVAHTHDDLVELLVEGRGAEAEEEVRAQVAHNHQIIVDAMSGRTAESTTTRGGECHDRIH